MFQKVLYKMASKYHVPKLDRGRGGGEGYGFPYVPQTKIFIIITN